MEPISSNTENLVNIDNLGSGLSNQNTYDLEDISEYTSSVSDSTEQLSSSYEGINYEPNNMLDDIFAGNRNDRPKRGRRPLRPYDPIRKKTEEKDKYWLRAFRSHIRKIVENNEIIMGNDEADFWEFYLGPNGKPGKGHKFLSYGKKYKGYLFANEFFVKRFRQWFEETGDQLLLKKYERGTAEWFVFYDYAARDLYYYCQSTAFNETYQIASIKPQAIPEDEFVIDENMDIADHVF